MGKTDVLLVSVFTPLFLLSCPTPMVNFLLVSFVNKQQSINHSSNSPSLITQLWTMTAVALPQPLLKILRFNNP